MGTRPRRTSERLSVFGWTEPHHCSEMVQKDSETLSAGFLTAGFRSLRKLRKVKIRSGRSQVKTHAQRQDHRLPVFGGLGPHSEVVPETAETLSEGRSQIMDSGW